MRHIDILMDRHTEEGDILTYKHAPRERDRQTDRQADRQTDSKT